MVRESLRKRLVVPIHQGDLAAIEANWRDCTARSEKVLASQYVQQHADLLRDLVCNASSNRQEIADGIIVNWLSKANELKSACTNWYRLPRRPTETRAFLGIVSR